MDFLWHKLLLASIFYRFRASVTLLFLWALVDRYALIYRAIFRAMYDQSFSAHQTLKDQGLRREFKLFLSYGKTHCREKNDSDTLTA